MYRLHSRSAATGRGAKVSRARLQAGCLSDRRFALCARQARESSAVASTALARQALRADSASSSPSTPPASLGGLAAAHERVEPDLFAEFGLGEMTSGVGAVDVERVAGVAEKQPSFRGGEV